MKAGEIDIGALKVSREDARCDACAHIRFCITLHGQHGTVTVCAPCFGHTYLISTMPELEAMCRKFGIDTGNMGI